MISRNGATTGRCVCPVDPYIVHPLAAATILADLYLDPRHHNSGAPP